MNRKIKTHYDNLKVSRDAPDFVIRSAYKALCQKYHPDKTSDPRAPEIIKIINESYATLSDPIKRKDHDNWIYQEEHMNEKTRTDEEKEQTKQTKSKSKKEEGLKEKLEKEKDGWLNLIISASVGISMLTIAGLFIITSQNTPQNTPIKTVTGPEKITEINQRWEYETKNNIMTGQVTRTASLTSRAATTVSSYNEHGTYTPYLINRSTYYPEIIITESNEFGNAVEIAADITTLECATRSCKILAKFDSNPPLEFTAIEETIIHDRRSGKYSFKINNNEVFFDNIIKSKRLLISKTPYKTGEAYIEFNFENIDPSMINI
jgi:hypothetical protein